MKPYDLHLFICENKRPDGHPRGCCADKNAIALKDEFKKRIAAQKLNLRIRVNSAGCLNACEQGAVMVIYPEGIWYGNVSLEDVDEIIEQHIVKGEVVKRLVINEIEKENI